MRKILLIDAANALYRAFFALPPLRNAAGQPTGAVLGIANMLRKAIREEKPDGVAVVMDPPGGSFRKEIFKGYKANRDAQPEDLTTQIPLMHELIEAWNLPVLQVAGFEADDVIATLVTEAGDDCEVVIVSTDKDLMQLVTERVVLLDTMKDKRVGPADVEARFGVGPDKLLDVRALVGDPSDNIPGVKGIGEKGAAKLILEWETLEALLENAESVKAKKAREGLQTQAAEARLSKELATLRTDVPLDRRPEDLDLPEPDAAVLRELYTRLEFTRLLDDLEGGKAKSAAPAEPVKVDIVTTKKALAASVKTLGKAEALSLVTVGDPEGGGLVPEPVGLAVAGSERRAFYWAIGHGDLLDRPEIGWEDIVDAASALFSGGKPPRWVAANAKRMQTLFAEAGSPLPLPEFDVGLAAFMVDPAAQRGISVLTSQWLGREHGSWEDLAGRGAKATPPAELSAEAAGTWAGEEACALLALVPKISARHESDGTAALYRDIELPLTRVLSGVERNGVRIDEAKLEELSSEYEAELARIEARIYDLAGESFTINSPKQLQVILFDKLSLPPVKKTKTGYSTDESVLETLAAQHDLPAEILAWRRLAKLKSTYIDALPQLVNSETGRIHPTFNQIGAATGRMSSTHPNVQNIPIRTPEGIRIREAFIPAEGHVLLSADYSQVELRVMAHYSGDASLIDAFAKGEDVHRRTAADVNGVEPEDVDDDLRAAAKAINFGIIYGSSAFGIANQLGIPQSEAQETINRYFERYAGVQRFLEETKEAAKADGYVSTLLGRRRYLPDLGSRNRGLRQAAERMAVNTVIQGTAADLIKKAMVEVDQALSDEKLPARMILQVHDELVFEVPPDAQVATTEIVRDRMENVYALEVPLVVEVGSGPNWRAAH